MTVLEQRFMEQVPRLLDELASATKAIAQALGGREAYVWVFTADQTADSEVMENISEVFATEEAAQAHLHKFVYGEEGELAYATKRGWVVSDNKPNHFCAYEAGRYVENHTEATIEKKEVKK